MMFDPMEQPFASNRYCETALNGMVCTGSYLASQAGLSILKKGGNAIDAAIATAACLTVVEPTSNGLGSDAFAIVWIKNKMYGLNASGYSPRNISLEEIRKQNPSGKMSKHGWTPVMVPGAVSAWVSLVKRFGRLSLSEDLAPAIFYAENGYAVSPMLGAMWERAAAKYQKLFAGRSEFDEWFRVFTKNGESYHCGDIVKLPDHARSLRLIAESEGKEFYEGEIARQFVKQSAREGGYFSMEDLSSYKPEWVEPVSVRYRGVDVWELPPNGQGINALMALNILNSFAFDKRDEKYFHTQLEAMKMAFADGMHAITDPACMKEDWHAFLKEEYGKQRAMEIGENAKMPAVRPSGSGTVYLCTADKEGNMVSYIQSNYQGFGSGIVVEGYGAALQNRGADFSLNEKDANVLAPHKRSYHTIIPGFLTRDGKALGPFGVMGAYMQPQGHVQVISNLIDFHLNPQMALDAPRWQWIRDKEILVEPDFDPEIIEALKKRGHLVTIAKDRVSFGRGEMILRMENGVLIGGTESRTDAGIACW